MAEIEKKCCFVGHRTIAASEELTENLTKTIERLIAEEGVKYFLFGSRSEFDDLCHGIVTALKEKYPHVVRVAYTRRSEYAVKAEEKEKMERTWASVLKTDVKFKDYDAEVQSEKVYSAGKASYVERNQEMIDASDFCVFYYNEDYQPPRRKRTNRDLSTYQPKSGTRLAYEYAVQKSKKADKVVINMFVCSETD
ncbi:MAG: hypothetical protein J6C92_13380 [Bacteroidaceae bacterium]|nr:hypothetical protein [Bacteroidaceae bacterium]